MGEELLLPPQDIDAERAVLGALILDGSKLEDLDSLKPEDFYNNGNQKVFTAMLRLKDQNSPIDIVTLSNTLKESKDYDSIGGVAYLSGLAGEVVTTANLKHHAKLVTDQSKRRLVRQMMLEMDITNTPLDDIADRLNNTLLELSQKSTAQIVTYKEIIKTTVNYIERRMDNKGVLSGIPSGFPDLDELTDGWQDGNLIILAARPSVGKSAVAMSWAHAAAMHGHPVGIMSLEMGDQEWGIRGIAQATQLNMNKFRKGYVGMSEYQQVIDKASYLAGLPIFASFEARDVTDLEKNAVAMIRKHGCRLLIVDYLQLIKGKDPRNREREVASVSIALKTTAKKFSIPVIALAQLNRGIEQRQKGATPMLSDLRESGQIEADADVIIMLYTDDRENVLNLKCAKGRNTGLGTVSVYFDPARMKFGTLAGNYEN